MTRTRQRIGFTLVEVLAALAVLAVATFVIASALTSVTRSQDLSGRLKYGPLVVRTIGARSWTGAGRTDEDVRLNGWMGRVEWRKSGSDEIAQRWRIWVFWPAERPSLRITFSEPLAD